MCLYHEATIVNLMEVMLYHRTAVESSEDALVEMIDYCYRKFIELNNQAAYFMERQTKPDSEDPKKYLEMDKVEELEKNYKDIEFNCAMICFSLVRFVSDYM